MARIVGVIWTVTRLPPLPCRMIWPACQLTSGQRRLEIGVIERPLHEFQVAGLPAAAWSRDRAGNRETGT
jgi:hypothetical protein